MKQIICCVLLFFFFSPLGAQEEVAAIGFWNVENLYDTVNDRYRNDEEFTPAGGNGWTADRYQAKLHHLAEVIALLATDVTSHGLALLGLCEVENKKVLADLVRMPAISGRNYQFILIDGPDRRGIDPALLYNPQYFSVSHASSHRVRLPDTTHATRDVLLVNGRFAGEPVALLVNHWPSRWGGESRSRPSRIAAASVVRHLGDSIRRTDPGRKLIIMGDLNDDPLSYSVRHSLGASGDRNGSEKSLFNTMEAHYRAGAGTLAWSDSWNLFDQLILSRHWLSGDGWRFRRSAVFNASFLRNTEGNFRGYPFRTFAGGIYSGGYSDHFPVYMIVTRKKSR